MKKLSLLGLTALSIIVLSACSNDKAETNNKTTTEATTTEKVVEKETKVDNSQYDDIVNNLKDSLGEGNSDQLDIAIINDVKDSDFPDGHNAIKVLLTGEAKNNLQEHIQALNSNTATADQKNAITLIRMSISQMAKMLPDDTTTIELGYEIAPDQFELAAKSSKEKDFIPFDDLVLE